MKKRYVVDGMTCGNCVSKVKDSLESVPAVLSVQVDLDTRMATVEMDDTVSIQDLREVLPAKYAISKPEEEISSGFDERITKSKLEQLKPLFIILGYIAVAVLLMHRKDWDMAEMMLDYMGLFFIVFSFFKMLDVRGFATSFAMYDPLAQLWPFYGRVYPFIETLLGVALLMRIEIRWVLILTIIVLGITTYGVTRTLLAKRKIRCACLGTALDLPMTEATFIENAIMIVMSLMILL